MKSPLQAALMAGGRLPLEKQNSCMEFNAYLAASWAAKLQSLRTE